MQHPTKFLSAESNKITPYKKMQSGGARPAQDVRQDTVEFRQRILDILEHISSRLVELERKIDLVSRQLPADNDRWTVLESRDTDS